MALPTVPTLTTPPAYPVRGEARATFSTKANAWVVYEALTLVPEVQASLTWMGTAYDETVLVYGDTVTARNAAQAAQALAETAQTGSETARDLANGYATQALGYKNTAETAAAAAQAAAGLPALVGKAGLPLIPNPAEDGVLFGPVDLAVAADTTGATSGQVFVADGVGGGSWTTAGRMKLIDQWTPTTVASKDFVWDESVYSNVEIVIEGIVPATVTTNLLVQIGYGNGATVISSTTYDYVTLQSYLSTVSGTTGGAYYSFSTASSGNSANQSLSGMIRITGANSTGNSPGLESISTLTTSTGLQRTAKVFGTCTDAAARTNTIDTVRLFWSAGNFTANGLITVYGLER